MLKRGPSIEVTQCGFFFPYFSTRLILPTSDQEDDDIVRNSHALGLANQAGFRLNVIYAFFRVAQSASEYMLTLPLRPWYQKSHPAAWPDLGSYEDPNFTLPNPIPLEDLLSHHAHPNQHNDLQPRFEHTVLHLLCRCRPQRMYRVLALANDTKSPRPRLLDMISTDDICGALAMSESAQKTLSSWSYSEW